jgi:hypothetical protein
MVHNEENRRGLTGLTDLPFLRSPLTEFRYLTPARSAEVGLSSSSARRQLHFLTLSSPTHRRVRMISNSRAANSQLGSRGFYWAT